MATNYDDDDIDEDFEPQDVVKQLRKVNRTLEKRLKELEEEATTLKTQTRQRTVKDVLTSKGINPKVATFIPQDIEMTEEAVTNWLNEHGDVFGVVQTEATKDESQAQSDPALQAASRIITPCPQGLHQELTRTLCLKWQTLVVQKNLTISSEFH
jgi:predicted RNase H-like nuclease (RuvC/YqgF family)